MWCARANQEGVKASRLEAPLSSSVEQASSDDTVAVLSFLLDAGLIGRDESAMTLSKMRDYVRLRKTG